MLGSLQENERELSDTAVFLKSSTGWAPTSESQTYLEFHKSNNKSYCTHKLLQEGSAVVVPVQ